MRQRSAALHRWLWRTLDLGATRFIHVVKILATHTERTRMTIELSKEDQKDAIASIERYFRENMEEKIGNVAAGGLLYFLLEEIGPSIYNKAVADVQERLQVRVSEVDYEIHEEEFSYWRKYDKQRKTKP